MTTTGITFLSILSLGSLAYLGAFVVAFFSLAAQEAAHIQVVLMPAELRIADLRLGYIKAFGAHVLNDTVQLCDTIVAELELSAWVHENSFQHQLSLMERSF